MKNKEIADQLGISIKAVEKQITKAIFGLKEYLEKKDLLFLVGSFQLIFEIIKNQGRGKASFFVLYI